MLYVSGTKWLFYTENGSDVCDSFVFHLITNYKISEGKPKKCVHTLRCWKVWRMQTK
jgi:hypothetical protein